MLGIKKIKDSFSFTVGEAVINRLPDSNNHIQKTTMLTERGLYKVLFKSSKPLAEEFQDHVCDLLEKERLKMGERHIHDKNIAVAEMKETLLIDKHKGKPGVYFMKHMIDKIVKFGCSDNVTQRIKAHKKSFGANNIFLDKVVETPRYKTLESSVKPLANTSYIDEQDHRHTKIIQYNDESELASIYGRAEASSKMIALPEYNTELEVERERSKQEEFKFKQAEALTRQLELQIKLAEMQNQTTPVVVQPVQQIQPIKAIAQIDRSKYWSENNEVESWLSEHIQQKRSAFLTLADVCTSIGGDNMHHSTKRTRVKEVVELFLTEKFRDPKCCMQEKKVNGKTSRGWMGYIID